MRAGANDGEQTRLLGEKDSHLQGVVDSETPVAEVGTPSKPGRTTPGVIDLRARGWRQWVFLVGAIFLYMSTTLGLMTTNKVRHCK